MDSSVGGSLNYVSSSEMVRGVIPDEYAVAVSSTFGALGRFCQTVQTRFPPSHCHPRLGMLGLLMQAISGFAYSWMVALAARAFGGRITTEQVFRIVSFCS